MKKDVIKYDNPDAQGELTNEQLELIKSQFDLTGLVPQSTQLDVVKLQNFNLQLNSEPPTELVKINKYANNTKYLPISFLEMLLDQISLGIWEIKGFRYEVLTNELVGKLTLRYYHPLVGNFIERVGVAAVQIQTKSGSDPYNIANKIPNTLVKQMGQLKAECFRNACKSIGKIFGRDLNRDDAAEFNAAYNDDEMKLEITRKIAEVVNNTKNSINNFSNKQNFNDF